MPSFGPDRSRIRPVLLALTLLACGSWLGATPLAAPTPDAPCKTRVAAFVRKNAVAGRRLVFTFTGTQQALLPLSEAVAGPSGEITFFPIDRTTFVATFEVRVQGGDLTKADEWAGLLCGLLPAKGARYNGALALSGNRMVDADMSRFGPVP